MFFIDTGIAVTPMHKDILDKVNTRKPGARLEPWAEQQLESVDGTTLQVYGDAVLDLLIDGTVYQAGVVVVSQLTIEAMLGLDFMRRDNVSIDLGEAKMKIIQEAPI